MKPAKILILLAALAGSSAYAVPASTTATFTGSASSQASITGSDTFTSAKGFVNFGGTWAAAPLITVSQNANGVGVNSQAGNPTLVEGTYQEFILLDFSGTATGQVQVTNLEMYFPNNPGSPFFTYQWVSAIPVPFGTTPTVPGSFVNATSGISSGLNNFTGISGQGKYLMLGAINGTSGTTNYFAIKSVTYTSVPDGASTLALMGAAVATLGLVARRRRA